MEHSSDPGASSAALRVRVSEATGDELELVRETLAAKFPHLQVSFEVGEAGAALEVLPAAHDTLTGLPSRALLLDRLRHAVEAAEGTSQHVGVGFLALDYFKRVNDSLGHDAGDALLGLVARRLSAHVRGGDTLARLAGDEFVIVWPDLNDETELIELAERARTALEAPFEIEGSTILITASVGVVLGTDESPDGLLSAADAAMYEAKRRGRGRLRVYTPELRDDAEARLRVEAELQGALERGEFVLHYQPIVDIQRNTITGVEALVRWEHPDGVRQPETFIPVAESSGLIIPLGEWVVREATAQAAAWAAEGRELDIAVNLSARQVSHPDTIATIRAALSAAGLSPSRLLIEVTEAAVVDNAEAASAALDQLVELGAGIAIDDFGTGYSSLVYLKQHPISAIKLDRMFVSGIGERDDDDAIVASVVGLARAVGAVCIAEGVETGQQWSALRALGCQRAQGYIFAKPVPADELGQTLEACAQRLSEPAESQLRADRSEVLPAVLARIEQLHASGASPHTIAAALNQENAPSPKGLAWRSASVMQVLATRVLS